MGYIVRFEWIKRFTDWLNAQSLSVETKHSQHTPSGSFVFRPYKKCAVGSFSGNGFLAYSRFVVDCFPDISAETEHAFIQKLVLWATEPGLPHCLFNRLRKQVFDNKSAFDRNLQSSDEA